MGLGIVRRLIPNWGTTYGPAGEGPFPAVMVLHGSEGAWSGWSHRNAVILAAHGFLAFPFGYSNGGNAWNAGSIEDVPLDRTVQGLAALRAFSAAGEKGLIVYSAPKPSLARAGVVPGQVLFRGRLSDPGVAEGTAFVFRRGCAPAPYRVSGAFANASDGTALVLKGKPPRRLGTGCAVQGHSDDPRDGVLRFRFLVSP